jgi:hypothetical protein
VRTTLTLEPDVAALIKSLMRDRGLTFKDAVNSAIRVGLRPATPSDGARTPTFNLGTPAVALTKALQIAAELEDDELVRKLNVGK